VSCRDNKAAQRVDSRQATRRNSMKFRRLVVIASAFAGLVGFGSAAQADAAAGKATFTDICSECHEVADFEGEDAAALQGTIKKIVAGQMKHKKALKLTDQQVADVAAYMAAGK
jgi:mono/diheme cytochrome c family protein